ncbi:adenosylcobinamide-phosphate synthase CbiB [Marivita sp. S6314]|uniref:adenosylcobinamide-phosphate synthase CbiB n=1 Tax=Marivita sp. S6314 TaxID=2926406 RepID=UPI001FF17D4E|nr:adenosylcobinamide-phosphate synthase CbiB [Marivita sp. S6314]MCK0150495.1 adenosylcobinamide-phosphate synthase CbiB [Marivita sp. S6314]
MMFAGAMILALILDGAIGWPDRLYQKIGHPVTWIGRVIAGFDRRLNAPRFSDTERLLFGAVTVTCVVFIVGAVTSVILYLLPDGSGGMVLMGVLMWPLIAMRSLHEHVAAVADALSAGTLAEARAAVSKIVGRDPDQLGAAGISRAALETLAENTSDGVVAPVFWGVCFGLPGLAIYKAINTLDSMIGHRNARYEQFGKVAARLDDFVNLIPARLTGLLFACMTLHAAGSLKIMWRDAGQHRSPNAGWPEAAMAGALGVRLSGPRVYGDRRVEEPWVNTGAPDPSATDIRRGLELYRRTMLFCLVLLIVLAAVG